MTSRRPSFVAALLLLASAGRMLPAEPAGASPPPGVTTAWDLASAYRETTPTRERVCINGLWRWQPAASDAAAVPADRWGFFKVPGCWPGITDYMQKDFQNVVAHPAWKGESLRALGATWYQREITTPANWTGRRIVLAAEYVNSIATVYVDGRKCGEIRFPAGELDLTSALRPGEAQLLSIHVRAVPLKDVLVSFADTNTAREVRGRVARRGLCGDVFLVSTPAAARIDDVKIDPSFRRREIAFDLALQALAADRRYVVAAEVSRGGKPVAQFTSEPFGASDVTGNRIRFARPWQPDSLWDTHTPQNMFTARCTLQEAGGAVADVAHDVRFGFREFWIAGRDFMLNGSRIQLSAVPFDNAQVGAALATYDGARESLLRLKSIGINFVYTHNYGCEPGSHLGFEEILRAADDVGMLIAFSQPHFSHYDWKAGDADRSNGYAQHAAFYVRAAQNHPSVVAYAMNHNGTGYGEDMNPDLIDGLRDPREPPAQRNAKLALRAQAIVQQLDGSRVVYHHSSGNLGSMHTMNFYVNFVPKQELSDWFEHWATDGVKPVFMCEYGAPFSWDWAMYRGWYKGEREFGSAVVPWQLSLAEWNAQFIGDRAFKISSLEADNLRWEAKQLAAGKGWHRWDYPHELSSRDFDERYPIFAQYIADNWPAFRTWGVSAISPWEHGHFWKLRPGVDKRRQELAVDWAHLQRPGFSPDFIDQRYERMDLAFAREDWIATPAAEALVRYNQPLLAYIAGKSAAFTGKDHVFAPGEVIEKQVIVINNSRETVTAEVNWMTTLPPLEMRKTGISLGAGEQQRVPIRFALPATVAAGRYELKAQVRFGSGATQTDSFEFTVVNPPTRRQKFAARIALFDPKGATKSQLEQFGITTTAVAADASLRDYDVLIVGQQALTPGGAAPDIVRVRDGLKVVLFEQAADVMEKRFGFRVAEYGLRQAFPRIPDHPALAGIASAQWRDWRGDATLSAPRLTYTTRPRYGPTVTWCDIPVTRLWRCGSRGNVASVLLEKPPRGDFRSIVDGGFGLQYSALLESREGRGLVVFCQLDVSGRTEREPTADAVVTNLIGYVANWKPAEAHRAMYAGDPAGATYFALSGVPVENYDGGTLPTDRVLILGPGATVGRTEVGTFAARGGRIIAIGLGEGEADALLPAKIGFRAQEHIATFFEPPQTSSPFAGIAPADAHNRDPRKLPLVSTGAEILGDGVLAATTDGRIVLCQLIPWQFDPAKQSNLKRTYRRTAYALARILANAGVAGGSPVLERFHTPIGANSEKRWASGLYLDQPEEWDDPYRFFRW